MLVSVDEPFYEVVEGRILGDTEGLPVSDSRNVPEVWEALRNLADRSRRWREGERVNEDGTTRETKNSFNLFEEGWCPDTSWSVKGRTFRNGSLQGPRS